jgi:hypothetical protein
LIALESNTPDGSGQQNLTALGRHEKMMSRIIPIKATFQVEILGGVQRVIRESIFRRCIDTGLFKNFEPVRSKMKLQHTSIYRGGATAQYNLFETDNCKLRINPHEQLVMSGFQLASKGGGITDVELKVGLEDIPAILHALAEAIPESATILADVAASAIKRNAESLTTKTEAIRLASRALRLVKQQVGLVAIELQVSDENELRENLDLAMDALNI